MNADIVGLMEIENDAPPNSALEELVAALNAAMGAGTYAFINTGVIGTDEIKVALIYKPAAVTPVGACKIIDSTVDPRFIDTLNRPSLAQTFQHNAIGREAHRRRQPPEVQGLRLRVGDPDTGDGQGNCNQTRTRAAAALVDWLATDPTGSGDPDVLLIGDMNSYTFEDPITTFVNGGYTNLVRQFGGLAPTRTSSTASPATSTTRSRPARSPTRRPARPTGTSTPTSRRCSTTTSSSRRRTRSTRSTTRARTAPPTTTRS